MRGKAAALVLAAIVTGCLAAPLYARLVSGTDPFRSNPSGLVAGLPVLAENEGLGVTPIGPGWRGPYLLGADALGRDVAARLLYGGRNSLLIAGSATALCLGLALVAGVLAGFLGGAVDAVLSALLDLLWAFPVYLLAISLALVLVNEGLRLGPLRIEADDLALPILILGLVYVPYVARPIRAEVIALRRREFVAAAVAVGGSRSHILRR
ncbi:MAG TPA: ABC transporter permease subunit, partial [Acetobacteraceae bacterium]|nr:ABC transporter permease subunit [Acetobacteraceae bacterium]